MSPRSLSLLLILACAGPTACRTEIPGPPDLPSQASPALAPPKTLKGKMICIYCDAPEVRQKGVDSSRWGRWHSGWNVSESPVVFAFPYGDENSDAHTPAQLIRTDYFTASYASRSRKKRLGSNPDPLAKAKRPRGKIKSEVDLPKWTPAPGITPRIYPELTSYGKFYRAAAVEADCIQATTDLYVDAVQVGASMLETDAPHLNKGDMYVYYEPDEARLYFSYTSSDFSVRYVGWYSLTFLTEDSGTAVQRTRCRNKEIEVRPMSFRIVPMNFTDRWLRP